MCITKFFIFGFKISIRKFKGDIMDIKKVESVAVPTALSAVAAGGAGYILPKTINNGKLADEFVKYAETTMRYKDMARIDDAVKLSMVNPVVSEEEVAALGTKNFRKNFLKLVEKKSKKAKDEYEDIVDAIEVKVSTGGSRVVGGPEQEPVLDEMGQPVLDELGQPQMTIKRTKKKIPYYRPNIYPIVLRKNITAQNKLLGGSDVDVIIDQQDTIKKLGTKINEKLLKGGSYVTLPKDVDIEKDGEDLNILRLENPAQKQLIDTINLQPNVQNDQNYLEINYSWAKSSLGITDSYQGKYDASATSGTAKQYAINQAAGRLDSKRTLKNEAYAQLYEIMFKFWLAFSDSPSEITSTNSDGSAMHDQLDRKEFLRLDAAGEFYWDDEFIFETDPTSTLMQNREAMWNQTDMKLQSGSFGPVGDLETARAYWTIMKANGYPNASVILNLVEERIEQQKAMAQPQLPEMEGGMPSDLPLM